MYSKKTELKIKNLGFFVIDTMAVEREFFMQPSIDSDFSVLFLLILPTSVHSIEVE